ncbi:hypothetical protein PSHT_06810 [Puccinia striiformis]|uniref:Transmembrane protein n=1 Tax=Puccinia striiformis TaxID=27350 RepID=A0A2S4W331_9BASI|nr:hypothetical protein PSHT_06810 [Puccinia striiformis]
MPHPIVIAAGMAIIVGAGYMIYTELNRKSDEEEAYHIYCATIRAEKESRYRRLQGLRDAEMVDSKVQHLAQLPKMFTIPVSDNVRLIILFTKRSTILLSTLASNLSSRSTFPTIQQSDAIDEHDEVRAESRIVIEADDQSQLAPQEDRFTAQEQEQSMDITENQHPLIDWKPQEESTTLGRLLGLSDSPLLTSASLQALEQSEFFETALPSQAVDQQSPTKTFPSRNLLVPSSTLPLALSIVTRITGELMITSFYRLSTLLQSTEIGRILARNLSNISELSLLSSLPPSLQ